jgi:hypothetical protein
MLEKKYKFQEDSRKALTCPAKKTGSNGASPGERNMLIIMGKIDCGAIKKN